MDLSTDDLKGRGRAIQVAQAEVTRRTWGVTRQFLAVNEISSDESGPVISRVDDTTDPGVYKVYFPIREEPYYLVVAVRQDPSGSLGVCGVYMEADVHVSLIISCLELPPREITARLDLEPTRTYERGESIGPRGARVREEHGWILQSLPGIPGSVEEKLAKLLGDIEPVAARIADLRPRCRVEVSVAYYGWGGDPQFGGFHFDAGMVQRFASIGAELDFDLYSLGPEMPEDDDVE